MKSIDLSFKAPNVGGIDPMESINQATERVSETFNAIAGKGKAKLRPVQNAVEGVTVLGATVVALKIVAGVIAVSLGGVALAGVIGLVAAYWLMSGMDLDF